MKRTIKIISLLLALLAVASFAASCGSDKSDSKNLSTASELGENEGSNVNIEFEEVEPKFINPLTGLGSSYDVSGSRPLGIMLNNIYEALPQVGIGGADIIFECLAEGGITRLFALFAPYKEIEVIGSIRSSRPYYLDFAQMFDAIYCHAGGSEDAYADIANRGINNIDGVRGDPLGVYYRDETRMQTMPIEHTLMTTGEGLVKTIEYCNYRTELRDGYEYPFSFPEWGKTVELKGDESLKIHLPISYYQVVDYEYDSKNNVYLRYQYNGERHIDGNDDKQLSFTNVIVIFCNTWVYDNYGRLKVDTVGEGEGFLATMGKYIPIKWQRSSIDGNVKFIDAETGNDIVINRGKTFINVMPQGSQSEVQMNAK